ncbi:hypothetical protein T08_13350 [Trichinella sp. T8]|nr:hypothetical protein T08_13350 [Trichinella sp. T8]
MNFIIEYFKYLSIRLKLLLHNFEETVVALVHNYLTGVAIAESAELAEITNTMSDSYITFIDPFIARKIAYYTFIHSIVNYFHVCWED